jgi:hypothetical protein
VSIEKILRGTAGGGAVVLTADELSALLAAAKLLREDSTAMAGPLRVLRVGGRILIQEQVPVTKQLVVRELPSMAEADRFVAARLDTYERMWDGCGCKIDYFE